MLLQLRQRKFCSIHIQTLQEIGRFRTFRPSSILYISLTPKNVYLAYWAVSSISSVPTWIRYLKKSPGAGVFLWILQNFFLEISRNTSSSCFWKNFVSVHFGFAMRCWVAGPSLHYFHPSLNFQNCCLVLATSFFWCKKLKN